MRYLVPILGCLVASLNSAAQADDLWQPFVLSRTGPTLQPAQVAVETGAGYNGLPQNRTARLDDSYQGSSWLSSAIGSSTMPRRQRCCCHRTWALCDLSRMFGPLTTFTEIATRSMCLRLRGPRCASLAGYRAASNTSARNWRESPGGTSMLAPAVAILSARARRCSFLEHDRRSALHADRVESAGPRIGRVRVLKSVENHSHLAFWGIA